MHRFRHALPVLLLALFLPIACDGGTGPGDGDDEPENLVGPEGGTLTSGPLTLEVPAGALDDSVEITITALDNASGSAPADFVVVDGTGFDLQPDGLTFAEPATLSIRVADVSLPAGVSLSELRLLRLDGVGARLPSGLDASQEVVTGSIEHFSSFGVGLATEFTRVDCPDLSLAATSGMPLDSVGLGTLPAELEPPLIVMATATDDSTRSYGGVEIDDGGAAAMTVPIHPAADPAGGEVRINVSDGSRACAGVDFTIAPLPAAAGEMEAVVDLLQGVLAAQAAELGTTPAELRDTPVDSLPPTLIPLALTQSVIDHPENDHALRAIVDGTSSEAADARLELLDALLARTGLRPALSARVAAMEAGAQLRSSADRAAPSEVAGIITGLCTPEYANTAALLDDCMDRAASAAFEGAADEVLSDLSEGMFYAALVPGLGTATAVGGALVWVAQTQDSRNAGMLPSLLTRMELDVERPVFMEDEEGPGTWTANVFATSNGYDMGKEALEGALQGAGISGIADKAQIAGAEIGDVTGWVLTGPVANELLEGGTIDDFIIEAENYGPVLVNDDAWSEDRVVGDAFSNETHRQFEPEEVGSATLSVRTEDGEFGGQQVAEQEELEVSQILMTVSPEEVYLLADQSFSFTFQVTNAKYPDRVRVLNPESLQGTVENVSDIGAGSHVVDYKAPAEPDPAQVDLLVLDDTASTGARENATAPRRATATIRFAELEISPRDPCVPNGEPEPFTATIEADGDPTVSWEIVSGGGTLSGTTGTDIQYTAPSSGTGQVTLRAYLEDNPENDDQVTFTYGVCNGLALYYGVSANIAFPFLPGGTCNNPDLDEEYREDNLPESGLDPLVPPDPSALLIDRTENKVIDLSQTGTVGAYTSESGCVYATFMAQAGYDATWFGSPTADSIDIDIQTYADSECIDMGPDLGERCSVAGAGVSTTVRFDLEIDNAASYDFDLELTCDAFTQEGLPEPTIDIITTRVAPDGTYLPPNGTTAPMSLTCTGGNTVTLDHVMEFAAAAEPDQVDNVMIMIQLGNGVPGAVQGISEVRHEGYIQGFITLRKQ